MSFKSVSIISFSLLLLVCSCSKTPTLIPIRKPSEDPSTSGSNSSSSFNSSYSDGSSFSSSSDPYNPDDSDYISVVPQNPITTVGSLATASWCNLIDCNGISSSINQGCRFNCSDLEKLKNNINCTAPDSAYSALNCNDSKFQGSNAGLGSPKSVSFSSSLNIEGGFTIYLCSEDPAGNKPRHCRAKNIAINKKPKNFRVLVAYPGGCPSSGDNNTGLPFTMFACSSGPFAQTVDILLEKIECSNWQEYNTSCGSNYTFGIRQNSSFINIDDEIVSFELLDCTNHRVSSSCHLK